MRIDSSLRAITREQLLAIETLWTDDAPMRIGEILCTKASDSSGYTGYTCSISNTPENKDAYYHASFDTYEELIDHLFQHHQH